MATTEEIAYVRRLIDEADDSNGWDDATISEYIDNAESARLAAADIWGTKASKYSKMVDISESGSSRKMSGLLDNALKLAKALREGEKADDEDPDAVARPQTRAIVRP